MFSVQLKNVNIYNSPASDRIKHAIHNGRLVAMFDRFVIPMAK